MRAPPEKKKPPDLVDRHQRHVRQERPENERIHEHLLEQDSQLPAGREMGPDVENVVGVHGEDGGRVRDLRRCASGDMRRLRMEWA